MRNQLDALINVIKNDDTTQVKTFLQENPSLVNFQDKIRVLSHTENPEDGVTQKYYSSITPLTLAIQNRCWSSARQLLKYGADPRLEGIDLEYKNDRHSMLRRSVVKVSAIQAFESVQSKVKLDSEFIKTFMEELIKQKEKIEKQEKIAKEKIEEQKKIAKEIMELPDKAFAKINEIEKNEQAERSHLFSIDFLHNPATPFQNYKFQQLN